MLTLYTNIFYSNKYNYCHYNIQQIDFYSTCIVTNNINGSVRIVYIDLPEILGEYLAKSRFLEK